MSNSINIAELQSVLQEAGSVGIVTVELDSLPVLIKKFSNLVETIHVTEEASRPTKTGNGLPPLRKFKSITQALYDLKRGSKKTFARNIDVTRLNSSMNYLQHKIGFGRFSRSGHTVTRIA